MKIWYFHIRLIQFTPFPELCSFQMIIVVLGQKTKYLAQTREVDTTSTEPRRGPFRKDMMCRGRAELMTQVVIAILILSPPITDTYIATSTIAYYFSTSFQWIYPHSDSER